MTHEEITKSQRRFEFAGAVVCSVCFGSIFWMMSLPSIGPIPLRATVSIVFYLLASASCYLGIFWLLDKCFIVGPEGVRPNWLAIPLLGTPLSFVVRCIPIWLSYGSRRPDYLVANIYISGFLSIVMLGVMAFVQIIGFVFRLVRKEIDDSRVVLDEPASNKVLQLTAP